MSRPLRIELAGGLFHVTARGNKRKEIFSDDADRLRWLELLALVCDRYRWRCLAYCLMGNHYRLIVRTLEQTLSRGIRQLNGVYGQSLNLYHEGHEGQGSSVPGLALTHSPETALSQREDGVR